MSGGESWAKAVEVLRAVRLRDAGRLSRLQERGAAVAFSSGVASDDLSVGPPPVVIRAALAREWWEGEQLEARASRRIPWSRSEVSEVPRGL